MKNKGLIIGGTIVVLAALFFVGSYLYKKSERERLEGLAKERNALFVRAHSPTLGPETAKVTLVEFLDPECETCRVFYPYVKTLLREHQGNLRLVVRYAPFHPNSKMAVEMLEAARKQGKYWETLELFFRYQPNWGGHHDPKPELLWTYLEEVGLDVEKIRQDMSAPEIQEMIEQDISDGEQLGVRKTPGFFVNGKSLEQFGYEELRQLIQSEM